MTVLSAPRHPLVSRALHDARTWCTGHMIDDRPALVHAVRVAVTLDRHAPDVGPHLICAALLHDSPEFAPPELDLDAALTHRYGSETTRIVRALQREHESLDAGTPSSAVGDVSVLLASTADKIAALSSLLHRARRSGDVHRFFGERPALLALLPHFQGFHQAAAGRIPIGMSNRLADVLVSLRRAASAGAHRSDRDPVADSVTAAGI
jgi:(p)ppGpp synthase/HD superfamily hydrolase